MITIFLLLAFALIASQKGKTISLATLFSLAVLVAEAFYTDSGIWSLIMSAVYAFIYSVGFFWLAFRVHNDIPQYALVLFAGIAGWFFLPVLVMNI